MNQQASAFKPAAPKREHPQDRTLVAYHEAGHAVAHVRLQILQGVASIEPDRITAGRVSAEDWCETPEGAEDQVIALCAGYAAVKVAGHPEDVALAGCEGDFEQAEDLIESWELGALADWKAKALEMMGTPGNRAAVQLVAEELVGLGCLDAQRIDMLVELADGNVTEGDYQRWLAMSGEPPAPLR